jgi:hypothetical protein
MHDKRHYYALNKGGDMAWDRQVPKCFGNSGLIFAGHAADEERAFRWLLDLRARSVGWKAARQQLKDFLKSKNARDEHITKQLQKAKQRMKPWLLD